MIKVIPAPGPARQPVRVPPLRARCRWIEEYRNIGNFDDASKLVHINGRIRMKRGAICVAPEACATQSGISSSSRMFRDISNGYCHNGFSDVASESTDARVRNTGKCVSKTHYSTRLCSHAGNPDVPSGRRITSAALSDEAMLPRVAPRVTSIY